MNSVTIEPISKENAAEIYDFEVLNRCFFEKSVPSRGDAYYEYETFNQIMDELMDESDSGTCCMNVIRNTDGEVVGRVNATNIENAKAEIGYRVGEKHNGKGYARQAIALIIAELKTKYNLFEIVAGTSSTNIGSQIALLKNEFEFVERNNGATSVNGILVDEIKFVYKVK